MGFKPGLKPWCSGLLKTCKKKKMYAQYWFTLLGHIYQKSVQVPAKAVTVSVLSTLLVLRGDLNVHLNFCQVLRAPRVQFH